MTNFEFYADEIKAINYDFAYVDGKITKCTCGICGEKCKFYDDNYDDDNDCETNKIKWLYSEHIEQPKLTQNEHKLCEILKDGYMTRTVYETLVWASNESPEQWAVYTHPLNDCDFSFIKNGDKPWSVEELLKLEVISND